VFDERAWLAERIGILVIRLIKMAHGYVRQKSYQPAVLSPFQKPPSKVASVDIPKSLSSAESRSIKSRLGHRFAFRINNTSPLECTIRKSPPHLWDNINGCFVTDGYESFTGMLQIDLKTRRGSLLQE
jgi:hypothetical protein